MRTLGWCTQTDASEQDKCGWSMNSRSKTMVNTNLAKSPHKVLVDGRYLLSKNVHKTYFLLTYSGISTPLIPFQRVVHVRGEGWKAISIHRQMLLYYGFAEAGQWGWSISPQLFPALTARLRLRLINHPAPALLLCFLFKCRIDGFSLHFIDLCIMVLSLLHHGDGAQRCRRACPGKDRRPGLCVAYCSAWRN